MIFSLIKLIIWVAGLAVVAYFVMGYFGYEVNWKYYQERRAICEERVTKCREDLIKKGLDGAKENCSFQCVDPSLLIRKAEGSAAEHAEPFPESN